MDPIRLEDKTMTTKFILPMVYPDKNFTDLTDFDNAYIIGMDGHPTTIVTWGTESREKGEEIPIPEEHLENFKFFLEGKYSKLSEGYKHRILDFWDADKNTILYKILYKDQTFVERIKSIEKNDLQIQDIEDIEAWYPPELSDEIYEIGVE